MWPIKLFYLLYPKQFKGMDFHVGENLANCVMVDLDKNM